MFRPLVVVALLLSLLAGPIACGKYGPPVRPEPAEERS